MVGSLFAFRVASRCPPVPHSCRPLAQSENRPWLFPIDLQISDDMRSDLPHRPPTRFCAVSQLFMLNWFICCAFCAISSIVAEICGLIDLIASWKANPSALLAVALSIATISSELMNEKDPENTSIPPQPALTEGGWGLTGLTLLCGKRVQILQPE